MAHTLRLRASNGQYLCAEGGGGRELVANRVEQGPWETFTIDAIEPSDGPLISGQRVAVRTASGQYLCAEGGGGAELIANRTAIGPWETFTIVHANLSVGEITSGQGVILRTANGQFLCAEGGGGREVTADRASIGPWETFTVEIESPTPAEPAPPAESSQPLPSA